MSSLEIKNDPWRAIPSDDTTVGQLAEAVHVFDLEVLVSDDLEVSLQMLPGDDRDPPATDELAQMIYGDQNEGLIIAEESGVFQTLDFEIRDRHFEEDADHNSIPYDVDLGLGNISDREDDATCWAHGMNKEGTTGGIYSRANCPDCSDK